MSRDRKWSRARATKMLTPSDLRELSRPMLVLDPHERCPHAIKKMQQRDQCSMCSIDPQDVRRQTPRDVPLARLDRLASVRAARGADQARRQPVASERGSTPTNTNSADGTDATASPETD